METSKESIALKSEEEFDPIQYIEKSFTDAAKPIPETQDDLSLEIPSISEFLGSKRTEESTPKKPRSARTRKPSEKLSAPRPRRRQGTVKQVEIDPEVSEIWARLPKNINFLSSFFDDKVTANYYRGEFKESREELIRRLLDPELSLEEVSRLLGVCPATVRRYTNRNWLKHHRTKGGQRRFRLTNVVQFVEEHGRQH